MLCACYIAIAGTSLLFTRLSQCVVIHLDFAPEVPTASPCLFLLALGVFGCAFRVPFYARRPLEGCTYVNGVVVLAVLFVMVIFSRPVGRD